MTKQLSTRNVILYADDDEDDRNLIEEAFAVYQSNVDVICFVNGVEIISYLESLSSLDPTPCLIILDINMPLLDGKEALRRIREMNKFAEIPAILFTTSSQLKDKSFAEKYNAGFITKPIDVEQLKTIADIFINHCTEEVQKKIRE